MNILTFIGISRESEQVPAHVRRGQHAFNVLEQWCPSLASSIRNTPIDPYHDDDKLPEFWNRVYDEVG